MSLADRQTVEVSKSLNKAYFNRQTMCLINKLQEHRILLEHDEQARKTLMWEKQICGPYMILFQLKPKLMNLYILIYIDIYLFFMMAAGQTP